MHFRVEGVAGKVGERGRGAREFGDIQHLARNTIESLELVLADWEYDRRNGT
jgi:hypothetical protein